MPILDERTFEFFSYSPEQTRRLGIHVGSYLNKGDVVCLEGDLGAGKTTLVQGIGQGWGTLDRVTSPTFVIVNEYRRLNHERLFHLDAYRLRDAQDAEALDFDRLLTNGTLVIEWAERIKNILPEQHLWIQFSYRDLEQRTMLLTAHGDRFETLLTDLRRKIYGVFS